jgi:hypothetical protein
VVGQGAGQPGGAAGRVAALAVAAAAVLAVAAAAVLAAAADVPGLLLLWLLLLSLLLSLLLLFLLPVLWLSLLLRITVLWLPLLLRITLLFLLSLLPCTLVLFPLGDFCLDVCNPSLLERTYGNLGRDLVGCHDGLSGDLKSNGAEVRHHTESGVLHVVECIEG